MKRSLELAASEGVNLRGVLTWAFTFPDTPYFAGYRALATNGIHLPVLNAFKLLGALSGERLPVVSSGARPLEEIVATGVRDQPDIDGLAALDGERLQILVWNYHDDLVEVEPARLALNVTLPPVFGSSAFVTHKRVDDTHGNAHAVWVAQGSPQAPTDAELRALREAMEPVVLEAAQSVTVTNGAVALAFELPRFGMSLLTLTPSNEGGGGDGGAGGGAREPTPSDPGCACRVSPPTPPGYSAISALFVVLLALRRRRDSRASRSTAAYF
jgi:xylan 1,4-beta-xylosidase